MIALEVTVELMYQRPTTYYTLVSILLVPSAVAQSSDKHPSATPESVVWWQPRLAEDKIYYWTHQSKECGTD